MKKVLIAIDSFKGSLTSAQASEAASEAVKSVFSACRTEICNVSDGGEGMLSTLLSGGGYRKITVCAADPLMRQRETFYLLSEDNVCYIELAEICGLPLVPEWMRNPMKTTTYGVGEVISDALSRGCREFVIGLGGSATNDAGIGALYALGFRFYDDLGNSVYLGGEALESVCSIDVSGANPLLEEARFTLACDVLAPFAGESGAAFTFAPQKGADKAMVVRLDEAMKKFAGLIYNVTGKEILELPRAGAAGGISGAFYALLNAELKSGTELLLKAVNFKEKLNGSDLVITGEGRIDKQTAMGKLPCGVLNTASSEGIPVIALAGDVVWSDNVRSFGFADILSVTPEGMALAEAMKPEIAKRNIISALSAFLRSNSVY